MKTAVPSIRAYEHKGDNKQYFEKKRFKILAILHLKSLLLLGWMEREFLIFINIREKSRYCHFSWTDYVGLNSLTISDVKVQNNLPGKSLGNFALFPLFVPCSLYPASSTFFWVASHPFKSFHHMEHGGTLLWIVP